MRKIFWENPYQTSLTTTIIDIVDYKILPEETIAFSFSVGQESDHGFINQFKILDSEIVNNLIFYQIEKGHNLQIGDPITMTIDWDRRYKLMRLHFAAELILELVTEELQLEKIGAHISENKARIDFLYNKNITHIFDTILLKYNDIIKCNLPIITGFIELISQKRFWEIEGFSKVPCGGTHVKLTGEVGYVTLKRVNIGNLKERIEIKLIN